MSSYNAHVVAIDMQKKTFLIICPVFHLFHLHLSICLFGHCSEFMVWIMRVGLVRVEEEFLVKPAMSLMQFYLFTKKVQKSLFLYTEGVK